MNISNKVIPNNVPENLIQSFQYQTAPGMETDPFRAVGELHKGPPIFWNPLNDRHDGRGTWDVIKGEWQREILGRPDLFTSDLCAGFSQLTGDSWRLTPLEIDPPQHTKYRKLLNPLVSPVAVSKLQNRISQRCDELLDKVLKDGGCEFMEAFGRPFPITIILELQGLPLEELPTYLKWQYDLLHNMDMEAKVAAAIEIRDYLRGVINAKRANPKDDFITHIANAQIDGESLSDDELLGICYLIFVGGLDTVASSLGFQYHHLATFVDQQRQIRNDPSIIPTALEELLRRFSVVMTGRRLTQDLEFHGIQFKKGDWVTVPMPTSSVDPADYANPYEIDLTAKRSRHLAFAFGPHFCMGTHIARAEMLTALKKWTSKVPEFRVRPNSLVKTHGGGVFGVSHLELEW